MIIKKKKTIKDEISKDLQQESISVVEDVSKNNKENTIQEQVIEKEVEKEPEIDLFDIENIDFTQRQERRRGSRRRGYRRIDDRNLVSRAQEESENIKKSAFEEGYRLGLEKAESDLDVFRTQLANFMNAKKDVFSNK